LNFHNFPLPKTKIFVLSDGGHHRSVFVEIKAQRDGQMAELTRGKY